MNYTKQLDLRRRFDEREKKKHQVRTDSGNEGRRMGRLLYVAVWRQGGQVIQQEGWKLE